MASICFNSFAHTHLTLASCHSPGRASNSHQGDHTVYVPVGWFSFTVQHPAQITSAPTTTATCTITPSPILLHDLLWEPDTCMWSTLRCSIWNHLCFLVPTFLFILASLSGGFFAAVWLWRPDSLGFLKTVDILSATWTQKCFTLLICEAGNKWTSLQQRSV